MIRMLGLGAILLPLAHFLFLGIVLYDWLMTGSSIRQVLAGLIVWANVMGLSLILKSGYDAMLRALPSEEPLRPPFSPAPPLTDSEKEQIHNAKWTRLLDQEETEEDK